MDVILVARLNGSFIRKLFGTIKRLETQIRQSRLNWSFARTPSFMFSGPRRTRMWQHLRHEIRARLGASCDLFVVHVAVVLQLMVLNCNKRKCAPATLSAPTTQRHGIVRRGKQLEQTFRSASQSAFVCAVCEVAISLHRPMVCCHRYITCELSSVFVYKFRVRAHNFEGWSQWSPASSSMRTKRRF